MHNLLIQRPNLSQLQPWSKSATPPGSVRPSPSAEPQARVHATARQHPSRLAPAVLVSILRALRPPSPRNTRPRTTHVAIALCLPLYRVIIRSLNHPHRRHTSLADHSHGLNDLGQIHSDSALWQTYPTIKARRVPRLRRRAPSSFQLSSPTYFLSTAKGPPSTLASPFARPAR